MGLQQINRGLGLALLLGACAGETPPSMKDTVGTGEPGPLTHRFSFAVIADPHIAGPEDHEVRLEAAVDWINTHAADRNIQLVLVLGDIGWGEGLPTSLELLSDLEMSWVPIVGDNVVISEQGSEFAEVFADQYSRLSETLEGWEKQETPVWDPNYELEVTLQNLRFEHEGVLFVGSDWNIRGIGGLAAEFADLHDFEGGSWPFFVESLEGVEARPSASVNLLSHIPLMAGALSVEEVAQVDTTTAPLGTWIDSAYAGHMHVTYDLTNEPGGYEVRVTDATWDDENVIRVVEVQGNEETFVYSQELVEVK